MSEVMISLLLSALMVTCCCDAGVIVLPPGLRENLTDFFGKGVSFSADFIIVLVGLNLTVVIGVLDDNAGATSRCS